MGLTKGFLTNHDTQERIEFMFNPTEYTLSKTNSWSQKQVVGKNVPKLAFTGGGSSTITMELFFDVFEQDGKDVRDYTDKLWNLCLISQNTKNPSTQKSDPPFCTFQWGGNWSFDAVITNLSIRFTLFRDNGLPVRATASVTLQEAEDPTVQKGTNPTSYAEAGHKLREVRPHDTLATIAYEEYGNPSHWRLIALANGMDDPSAIGDGDVLAIPPLN